MAMTLRLSPDEHALLRERAKAEGISMHEFARRSILYRLAASAHRERVDAAAMWAATTYKDALERLADM